MVRQCFALDLKDDPALIAEYESYHKRIWPEVLRSIKEAGIGRMEIYRTGNRLFMIVEASEEFSVESKAVSDASNERVLAWEELMWKYQQALPKARPGEKWVLMQKIFQL